MEKRLQPITDKRIVLNSFILSTTPSKTLDKLWDLKKQERRNRHIFCFDEGDCIEGIMRKILEL
jgi:hypothetical protein